MSAAQAPGAPELKRVLRPVHLWAIAVGLVISGDYFGWNYGVAKGGPMGMAIATLIVTVMYVTFIFSYTELSTALPHSGGPFAYAHARARAPSEATSPASARSSSSCLRRRPSRWPSART